MIKKQSNKMAIAAGMVGAAAAGAAAVALADKKNRKKAADILMEAKDRGVKLFDHAQKETAKTHKKVKKIASEQKSGNSHVAAM